MTTSTSSIDAYTPDGPSFAAWAGGISAALQAAGLVKTADTGQVSFTGLAKPASNSDAGYEVYSMGSGATEVFLKVRYGINPSGGASLKINVAGSTDGAGNLTGTVSSDIKTWINFNQPGGSSAEALWVASDGATYLTLVLGANLGGTGVSPFALIMGRTVGLDGTPTAAGWTMHWTGRSRGDGSESYESGANDLTNASDQFWITTILHYTPALAFANFLGVPVAWPAPVYNSASSGDDLYFFPAPPVSLPSPSGGQPLEYLGVYGGDLVVGSDVVLSVNGAPHHYRALGQVFDGADSPGYFFSPYSGNNTAVPESDAYGHCVVARFE